MSESTPKQDSPSVETQNWARDHSGLLSPATAGDTKKVFFCSKTYEHSVGLSCCFRQWKAHSHCRFLHGYALQVKLVFEADQLDGRNWVLDFGGLKEVKDWLVDKFDHKTIIAQDDPYMLILKDTLPKLGVADVRIAPAVGCEAFADYIFNYVDKYLTDSCNRCGVRIAMVEVREHGGNSAGVRRA